ncbi:MAG: competence/damage-inducible protein A [Deltaproteobacteria bacterium]|nr:competence/damage-inducible protein A [Deltaproteobacteria bacterium]
MTTEIITIGDEILSGNVVDTNTAYLADQLWLKGIEVAYHTAVRDDAAKIREALLHSATRAELVLVSGGLGPTSDDFTIEVAAKAFKKKLVIDSAYVHYLENLFKQWGRPLAENSKKQAYVPQGAKTFHNRVGTAPGIGVKFKKTQFYFMPGVPKELKQLFHDFILPEIIAARKKALVFESKMLKCFGTAEAALDAALKDMYVNRVDIENVRIGFRAHFPETFIKLSAWDKNGDQARKRLHDVEAKIRDRIGKYIYGEGDDTLEGVVGALLAKKKQTLAVAESCTGGLAAHRITNVPGASKYFLGGVVSYSNESKTAVLGVSPDTLKKHGAVSSQCAIEMAQGVRRVTKADYAVSITGIAGPAGGTTDKPVGTFHVALVNHSGNWEKKFFFPVNREWFKLIASSVALERVRRALLGLPVS